VRVTANGNSVRGVTVTFSVTSGAATVSPSSMPTDTSGQARTQLTLGSSAGNVTVTAAVGGTSLVATFVVTAGSGTVTAACNAGAAQIPAAGTVLPGVNATGVCLGGGTAGAEYALVSFYANPTDDAVQSFTVTGRGATPVATPSLVTRVDELALASGASNAARANFDARLRATAHRELAPRIPAARRIMQQRRASFNVIPSNPAIGSLVTLNANGNQPCTRLDNRVSRIAAVSNLAIIVADTANPVGGFTDAEYQSFATMFDTLISPLGIASFGATSDIDRNGKVVIFFTRRVNELTGPSDEGTIGGFFFERDLFPLTDSGVFEGCAGSNLAEMFYLLVPDPNGLAGKRHTKQDVLDITPGTIAHEFQHLINAGRRMYVNEADAFEETWLNEGLSHIAEELLYYRVSRFAPRQNIASFSTQASADAWNKFQSDNNARYELYINRPSQISPYADNDDLATRGATWNMLRYLADHRGTSDGDTWTQLVNTTLTGQANLSRVFGSNYLTQIRDWSTSVFSDDVAGVTDTRFLQPSWNMRSLFPRLQDSQGRPLNRFPLTVVPLAENSPATLSLISGATAYLRFAVPANGQASVDWSSGGLPVSGLMQFTVVRTR
jgi:hypothetical protein